MSNSGKKRGFFGMFKSKAREESPQENQDFYQQQSYRNESSQNRNQFSQSQQQQQFQQQEINNISEDVSKALLDGGNVKNILKHKIKFGFDTNKQLFNKVETHLTKRIEEVSKNVTIPFKTMKQITESFYRIKEYEQQLQNRESQQLDLKQQNEDLRSRLKNKETNYKTVEETYLVQIRDWKDKFYQKEQELNKEKLKNNIIITDLTQKLSDLNNKYEWLEKVIVFIFVNFFKKHLDDQNQFENVNGLHLIEMDLKNQKYDQLMIKYNELTSIKTNQKEIDWEKKLPKILEGKVEAIDIFETKIGFNIYEFLDYKDILALSQTNHQFYFITQQNYQVQQILGQKIIKIIKTDLEKSKSNENYFIGKINEIPEQLLKKQITLYCSTQHDSGKYMVDILQQSNGFLNIDNFDIDEDIKRERSKSLTEASFEEEKQLEQKDDKGSKSKDKIRKFFEKINQKLQTGEEFVEDEEDFYQFFLHSDLKTQNDLVIIKIFLQDFRQKKRLNNMKVQQNSANKIQKQVSFRFLYFSLLAEQANEWINNLRTNFIYLLVSSQILYSETKQLEGVKNYLTNDNQQMNQFIKSSKSQVEDFRVALESDKKLKDMLSEKIHLQNNQIHENDMIIMQHQQGYKEAVEKEEEATKQLIELLRKKQEADRNLRILVKELKTSRLAYNNLKEKVDNIVKKCHELKFSFENCGVENEDYENEDEIEQDKIDNDEY